MKSLPEEGVDPRDEVLCPLVGHHVSGVRDELGPRVGDAIHEVVRVLRRCELVLLAPDDERRRLDPA